MKHPKHILSIGAFLGLAALAASCERDPNDRGIQYAPEMYEAIPYEPYKQVRDSITPFMNHQTMQAPPEGTVPRGGYLEGFEFGPGDSMRVAAEVIAYPNPIEKSPAVLAEGEVLYNRFCAACHGKTGAGNGPVTKNPAIKPQSYSGDKLKGYTDGQIYHTIMYGQGVMGSYTSQVQYEDRWKIVHYVRTLQGTEAAASDSAAVLNEVPKDSAAPADNGKGKGK
jgi:mono/diheme cytochrome c family protein